MYRDQTDFDPGHEEGWKAYFAGIGPEGEAALDGCWQHYLGFLFRFSPLADEPLTPPRWEDFCFQRDARPLEAFPLGIRVNR